MSSAGVFPTKWHFLVARVLVGVDRTTGVFTGTSADDADYVCVWTSEQGITASVDEDRFEVKQIDVESLLAMLPPGIGVVVDIGSDDAMWVDPDYAATLKQLATPFPADRELVFREWVDLPASLAERIDQELAGRSFARSLFAMVYTVEDSPYLGLLAYAVEGSAEAEESVVDAVVRALAGTSPAELDVATVRIVSVEDLPPDVRAELARHRPLYVAR